MKIKKERSRTMKRQILYSVIFFIMFSISTSAKESLAAPYYEGKVIKIIVGHAPGGGYDRISRLIARHIPKHIPGKPTLIVENMPGANSIIAANYLYNIAKPDGLTIGNFDRSTPFAQLLKAEGVRFDNMKYSWIGSASAESAILTLRADLPYRTVDDLKKVKEPIPLASMGPGAIDTQFVILLKEFVGLNFKMVVYPSSSEGMLAVERKEVDGRPGSYSSLKPFIERGLVVPMIRGRVSEPGIEKLPVDEDLTMDPKGKTMMAMRSVGDGIGRPYVAPPGTPGEIMAILRDAFARVAKDPELKEDAKKNKMEITYIPAEDCMKVLNYLFNQPQDIIKEFNKYVKF
jgi:tripartite-type tricarboxylate transporter receptor subunit TctC